MSESQGKEFTGTERFRIRRRVGEGGMGVVYTADDLETNSLVALKTLRVPNAAMLLRFKNEFRALQTIRHPNLVQLGELFTHQDVWFFTIEFVEGVDILSYVREVESTEAPDNAIAKTTVNQRVGKAAAAGDIGDLATMHAAEDIGTSTTPNGGNQEPILQYQPPP